MGAISTDPRLGYQVGHSNKNGVVTEEIEGLIRVYKDGNVERLAIVPNVSSTAPLEADVVCKDITIDPQTNVFARVYVPRSSHEKQLPLLVYFHGGGFCVGSASWICYHSFLSNLASKAGCVIMSVNYRLAPENRLPAAYDDGFKTLTWVKLQVVNMANEHKWWWGHCNLSRVFLSGDSAGANIVYNLATRIGGYETSLLSPLSLKGIILIQPFFGGEGRTHSEKCMVQGHNSALCLAASDVYWRLALPLGTNRDHPWCNPLAKGACTIEDLRVPTTMVFVSELDILKDRNLQFCNALRRAGKKVDCVVSTGVGHAFQVLDCSQISQTRTLELVSHIKAFISQ